MNSFPSARLPQGSAGTLVRTTLSALMLLAFAAAESQAQVTSYAVVPNQVDSTASVIETRTHTVRPDPLTVGNLPEAAAWTPDGRVVYVSNVVDNTVSYINVAAGDTLGGDIPVGLQPAGIAISPDGRFAYVANNGSDTISVIDTINQQVDGSPIDVPAGPLALTISPDGSKLYVTSVWNGDISIVDTLGRNVIATVNVGCEPSGVIVTPDGSRLYVASCATDTVDVYDATDLTAGPQISVGTEPLSLTITPDGRWVYVANNFSDDVTVIDTTTDTVLTTITGLGGPYGIAVTPDGKEVYVTNTYDTGTSGVGTTVSVIDVATNTIDDTLTVGAYPVGHNVFISPSIVVADGGPLVVSSDAELDPLGFRNWVPFNGGTMVLTNSITSTRQLSLLIGNGQIITSGFDASFKGIDFASGTLVKAGAGTLTLNGDGWGDGYIVADAGRLVINGANPGAIVTINAGVALSGVGQMSQLTVNNGDVAPGNNGPGILSADSVSLSAGSTLRIELNGPTAGTGYDRLQTSSVATISGATLSLQTNFQPASGEFLILTNASGTFLGLPQGTAIVSNGVRFRISYTGGDGNDVTLTVDGPPAISVLTDRTILENQTAVFDFTVADDFTAPAALVVTTSSSNTALLPNDRITVEGTGTTRTMTIAPAAFASGTTTITVMASDGTLSSQRSFLLTVTPAPRYLLSEGATGAFFDTDVIIANPQSATAPVRIIFTTEAGVVITQDRSLLPMSQTRIKLDDVQGLEATSVSTMVISTSGVELVVERTMRWDSTGYGAHAEKASPGASPEWFFAEGSQGFFSTFLLLANPNASDNVAHVTWLRENATPVQRDYPMGPSSRVTVHAGDDAELVNTSFGARVVFDQPGVAERAMYFGTNPLWKGGHESAGISAASPTWFLAEGATGSYFTTYVLLANPNDQPTDATVRYLPDNGAAVTKVYPLGAQQRLTLNIAVEDPALANAAVATEVSATLPIVAERAQYWPGVAWEEAHASAGVTSTGTRWGLADGQVGGTQNHQTYILLANPGATESHVVITFLRPTGETITRFFDVPAASRKNVSIAGPGSDVPELINASFGAIVESSQPIAVERSMYSDAGGVTWAAGTNVTGTRLPER
jgi:YVTN family beta-propeller protein